MDRTFFRHVLDFDFADPSCHVFTPMKINKSVFSLPALATLAALGSAPSHAASTNPSSFSIGPSIALLGGGIGLGADVRYLYEVVDGLKLGVDTGIKIYPSIVLFLEVPAAAMVTYTIPANASVKPYVGASIGTSILIISGTVAGLGTFSGAAPTLRFLGHAGIEFGSSTGLDLGFGVVGGAFTFTPSLLFHI